MSKRMVVAAVLLFGLSVMAYGHAEEEGEGQQDTNSKNHDAEEHGDPHVSLTDRDYPFGNWWGAKDFLADSGVQVDLSYNSVYQTNVHGGVDTQNAHRGTGSYDLELTLDIEKILGIKGGTVYSLIEGGFGNGLDGAGKIGDLFGVNANAVGHRAIDVSELWYEHSFLDDTLLIRAGKIDLTGGFECRGCPVSFDGNSFANDETAQFMNNALVNNPTVPFPDNGLGIVIYYNPVEWFYGALGVGDAQADLRETGLNTGLHDEDYFTYLFEFGFVPEFASSNGPLTGAYRFGLWYDPQPKERFFNNLGGRLGPRQGRDDVGFYVSFDQMVYREDEQSDQGLALFFRYGFAHGDVNEIEHFWSIGGQYQGLIPNRDNDVLGFGVAQGLPSNELGHFERIRRETVLEMYYNIEVTEWLHIAPDVQVIVNPGGTPDADDAVAIGLRLQMSL